MSNRTIILDLQKKYQDLNHSVSPTFKKKEKVAKKTVTTTKESRIVINSEWNKLSDKRIDLIIVADNPGELEEKNNLYMHPDGPAGECGRTFIDHYYSLSRKRGQHVILNKTPFWSNNSTSLQDNKKEEVKKSVALTFQALIEFWKTNPNVHILVVGLNKDAIMNKYFFKIYSECENEEFKRSVHFGMHPSYGHLDRQLTAGLVKELLTKRKIKIDRVLRQINVLNKKVILKNYGVKI